MLFGDMIGAGLNYFGAREANRMNQKIVREQMHFQRESNREQMGFQERMSNTAYQRAVADMISAGLNPVLAFQQGGASTPSGSSSPGSSARMENEFAGAVSSALEAKRLKAEIASMKVQNKNVEAQTLVNHQLVRKIKNDIVRDWVETALDVPSSLAGIRGLYKRYGSSSKLGF